MTICDIIKLLLSLRSNKNIQKSPSEKSFWDTKDGLEIRLEGLKKQLEETGQELQITKDYSWEEQDLLKEKLWLEKEIKNVKYLYKIEIQPK